MKTFTYKLPKRIILLGWVSFFADISSEMIYPLVPLFLVGVLGSSTLSLGLIEGTAQAIVSIMAVFSGAFTDRTKKRVPFVRWGYGLPIIGKFLISIAGSWSIVLLGRSIDRLGKGLRGTPRDALIAEAIDSKRRGEAFGYHRMMDTAGAFIGVLISGGALWFLQYNNQELSYRLIFGLASILALCSLIVSLFVDETSHIDTSEKKESTGFSFKNLGKEYWTTLSLLTLFAFANSSDAFLLLRASDVGLSAMQVVLIYALYNLTYSLFSYSSGKLSDNFGRWRIILIGWIIYAVVYAGMATTDNYFIWILFALYGFYMALTEGTSKALIVDSVPYESKGTALGIFYFTLGISALSSNMLAGYLWDNFGKALPFWLGSFTSILCIIALLLSGRLKNV